MHDYEDFLAVSMDEKRKPHFWLGLDGLIISFVKYTHECFEGMPDGFILSAIPSRETIKTKRERGVIASEPVPGQARTRMTRAESAAPAFVNSAWRYCGNPDFAEKFLGLSESWWAREKHKHCRPDRWNHHDWFVPSSYGPIRQALIDGTYYRQFPDKPSPSTDVTGGGLIK
jgi:hypothetical protein